MSAPRSRQNWQHSLRHQEAHGAGGLARVQADWAEVQCSPLRVQEYFGGSREKRVRCLEANSPTPEVDAVDIRAGDLDQGH